MSSVLYATSNPTKFRTANSVCSKEDVHLKQITIDIPEVQSNNPEEVARDKAHRAFEVIQQPLIISDDSWFIFGLNSFPGPLMKYIDETLTSKDWLRLTKDLEDRRVVVRQVIVFQDSPEHQQLFYTDVEGILLKEIRGNHNYSMMSLVSFDDGATSVAESLAKERSALAATDKRTSWHDFCQWYKNQPE